MTHTQSVVQTPPLRVLVVGADGADRDQTVAWLTDGHANGPFEVRLASALEDSLSLVAAEKIDCVLFDVTVLGGRALKQVSRFKAVDRTLAVVLLLPNPVGDPCSDDVALGVDDCLERSAATTTSLTRMVRSAVERAQLKLELSEALSRLSLASLEESERQRDVGGDTDLELMVQSASDGFVITDLAGTVVWANRAGVGLFGGKDLSSLAGSDLGVVSGDPLSPCEVDIIRNSGETGIAIITAQDTRWKGERARLLTFLDVTDRKELIRRSLRDSLTGLPNRVLFVDRVERAVLRTARLGTSMCVMFIDLDMFKQVNDALGHAAGDAVLIEVGQRFADTLRESDTVGSGLGLGSDSVARLGGDEFVCLCESVGTVENAEDIAKRLGAALSDPILVGRESVRLSASIGVVFHAEGLVSAEELMGSADVAMYSAKSAGRDGYAVFNHALRDRAERRYQLGNRLRDAFHTDQLEMHYQPIVDPGSGVLVGAEALIRWRDGDGDLIPAGEFIPIAEESTLILDLGAWIMSEVCAQTRRWEGLLGPERLFTMHMNVSARQLGAPDLVSGFETVLTRHRLSSASQLVVELTETAMMDNLDHAKLQLGKLRELGCRIAIDDYGTAYSTLTNLRELPVDIIKIDQSFVAGVGHDRWDERICASQIDLAHALGMTVIAEGVESERQHAVLIDLNCDLAQGYWYGRPVPPHEFEKAIDEAVRFTGRIPNEN